MSGRFFKIAVVAFVASVGVGLFMGIGHDRSYVSLHAHLALTGWVSMALFAIAYRLWPHLGRDWLAKSHFWLYTVGFFVTMIALALLESGNVSVGDPLAGLGSTVAGLGVLCFAAQVLRTDLTTPAT
jgi:cbb3-type cytochrome oxidase subunit 1